MSTDIPTMYTITGIQNPTMPFQENGPVLKKTASTPPMPVTATHRFMYADQRGKAGLGRLSMNPPTARQRYWSE